MDDLDSENSFRNHKHIHSSHGKCFRANIPSNIFLQTIEISGSKMNMGGIPYAGLLIQMSLNIIGAKIFTAS